MLHTERYVFAKLSRDDGRFFDMNNVQKILQYQMDPEVLYVAAADGDKPLIRPFSGIHAFAGTLDMPANNMKEVLTQMMENPHIEIGGMARANWIRVEAEIVCDQRMEARVNA